MEDDHLAGGTDFGELFEGETAVFASPTPFHDGDVPENGVEPTYRLQVQHGLGQKGRPGIVPVSQEKRENGPSGRAAEEEEDPLQAMEGEDVVLEKKEKRDKIMVKKDLDFVVRVKINQHLRSRGYKEILMPKVIGKEELGRMLDPSLYRMNSVSYGGAYRAEEVFEELDRFLKFYQFLKSRSPSMSAEICPLLMPLLVFFVRELNSSGHKPLSSKLVGDFCDRFLAEDKTNENCLITLALGLANGDKYLKSVCKKQQKFYLSDSTFLALKRFLLKMKKGVLLNVLATHFVIELKGTEQVKENLCSSGNVQQPKSSSRVQKVLDRLRGSVAANLPCLKVYTTNCRVTAACMSSGGSMVAFGSSSLGIRLYNESSARPLDESDDEGPEPADVVHIGGHEGSVYGLGFHPKAKFLYSAGQDAVMRVWDVRDSSHFGCKAAYRGHFRPVWALDIAPSGQLIVTGSMDSTARLWVPERTDCVRIFAGHYLDVNTAKFHPNESYVATGSSDKSARLWSTAEGVLVRVMTGMEGRINTLAFHNSGNYLIGGGVDSSIRVWDIREGELLAELPSTNSDCRYLDFGGSMLAGCFRNGSVQIWNLRNIVGGETPSEELSVPTPHNVQCQASSLVALYYKDVESLYCLGSSPNLLKSSGDISLDSFDIPSQSECNSKLPNPESEIVINPKDPVPDMYIRINSDDPMQEADTNISSMESQALTPYTPVVNNVSFSNPPTVNPVLMSSEDVQNCLEDVDADNTNNTITSSDMEFEVDEQILEAFVDDTSLLQSQ